MKRFLLLSVLTFTVLFAFSQITIRGTVTECQTGEELIGATVQIVGTNFGTVVDLWGNFEFKYHHSSENDTITIKFSYMDFSDEIRTIEVSDDDCSDKIYTINVRLRRIMDKDEVIIMLNPGTGGTRRPRPSNPE